MAGTFPGGGGFPSVILPGRAKEFHYETSLVQNTKSSSILCGLGLLLP